MKWRLLPLIFNNLLVVFGVFFSILNLSVDPFRALTGYVCAGGLFLLFDLIYPKGLGGGDVVMAAGLGVWLGVSKVILALLIAFGMGALYSFPLFLFGKVSRKTMIPFGPFLALGALYVWFFPSLVFNFFKR